MNGPEYPLAAEYVPASPFNYRPGAANRQVSFLVIHVTDGHGAARPVAEMWQAYPSESRHTSAHFVVGQDGEVIQAVRLQDIAQHAHAASAISIGIEHCARTPRELGPNDAGMPASAEQYAASSRLVAWLCSRYGIPCDREHVLGHNEADTTTTHADCPTGALDIDRLVAMAAVVRVTGAA